MRFHKAKHQGVVVSIVDHDALFQQYKLFNVWNLMLQHSIKIIPPAFSIHRLQRPNSQRNVLLCLRRSWIAWWWVGCRLPRARLRTIPTSNARAYLLSLPNCWGSWRKAFGWAQIPILRLCPHRWCLRTRRSTRFYCQLASRSLAQNRKNTIVPGRDQ